MRRLLMILVVALCLIVLPPTISKSISDDELENAIVVLYAINLVKSSTMSEIHVDVCQWASLTPENKKFVAYLFVVKKVRFGALSSDVSVCDHESGAEIAKYRFNTCNGGESDNNN